MIGGRFAGVVCKRPLFSYCAVYACRQNKRPWHILRLPDLLCLICHNISTGYVNSESHAPLIIWETAILIGSDKDTGCDNDIIDAAICEKHLLKHLAHTLSIGDVGGQSDSRTTARNTAASHTNAHPIDFCELVGRCLSRI